MAKINWKTEFDKIDEERCELYRRLRKEQIKRLLVEKIMECDDEGALERLSCFVGASFKIRLVDNGLDNMNWVSRSKEGVA